MILSVIEQGSSNLIKQGGKTLSMSMSKLLITLGLILLMTTPLAVAHADSQAYRGSGTAVISDAGAMSDKITYSLSGVTVLGAGSAYEGWLVNSSTDERISTGMMMALPDGSLNHAWISPDGANLLEMYDMAEITVETDSDPAPSTEVAFSDSVGGGAMEHIRGLIVGDSSSLYMLQMQIVTAMAKVHQAQSADSLDGVKSATEEVVGIIDADDGIMALAMAAGESATTAMDTPGEAKVSMYAGQVSASMNNVQEWATAAKEDAAVVTAQGDMEVAKVLLNIVNGKLIAALNGVEVAKQGGASDAYVSAQKMATFTLPAPPAPEIITGPIVGDTYVPAAMQIMLIVAMTLIIGGGALMYRERRLNARA